MKELFNKSIPTSTAILISCIAVYGIVYAQQVCCSTFVNACIPTFNRVSDDYTSGNSWTTLPSHHHYSLLRSNPCLKNLNADFGSGNTCCETDRCDGYNQAAYISLSFIQDFYPLNKNVSISDTGNGSQTPFELYWLPTSLKALPIYIMTQSIIC